MQIKNLYNTEVFDISTRKLRVRKIVSFDLENKKIVLNPTYEKQDVYHRTFLFDSLNSTSLVNSGASLQKEHVVFFTREEALKGLIALLEKDKKYAEEEVNTQQLLIKKLNKRLELLKTK
jgi:hypothetical protein